MNHFNLPHGENQLNLIRDICKSLPSRLICVEIGVHVGVITSVLAEGEDAVVYSIDPWTDESYGESDGGLIAQNTAKGGWQTVFKTFCENNSAKLFRYILPLRARSEEIAPYFNIPINLVYIDGNHEYEYVKRDIELWFPKIVSGGIIMGDDYGSWGVKQAVDEKFPNKKLYLGNMWVVKKD